MYQLYLWITHTIKWALYFISYIQSSTYKSCLFFALLRMTFLSLGLGGPSCVQGDQHADLAWCFQNFGTGPPYSSIRFPSLRTDFPIHIISIFLVDQPWICFEPRLKKSLFLSFRWFCLCWFFIVFIRFRIILLYCSCCFLFLMSIGLGPFCKWELCLPLQELKFFLWWHLIWITMSVLWKSKQEETESKCMESKNIHFCKIPLIMKIEPVMNRM